ncbi:MAG: cytochrome b [Gallionella sp.]|jgi:cytochrome b561
MNWKNTEIRYGSLTIGIHWLMLLLFIAVYASIELRSFYPKGSDPREALKTWHFMLGMLVFVLVWPRIAARLSGPAPAIEPAIAPWQQLSAKLLHLALYAFMIAMPLIGWLLLSASGKPIPFFGLELPALIDKNKDTANLLKEIHETIGTAGYYLIGLHAAAALHHHYIKHDNTLTRMLPERK